MPVGALLFSTQGRIGPRLFWRGVVLLVAIQVVMQLVDFVAPQSLDAVLAFISYPYAVALFTGYLAVYAKRLHDAGHTGWFFLLAMVGGMMLEGFLMTTGVRMLLPELWDAYQSLLNYLSSHQADLSTLSAPQVDVYLQDIRIIMSENGFVYFAINLFAMFLANAIAAVFVARLPSEPGTNRFGPPRHKPRTSD